MLRDTLRTHRAGRARITAGRDDADRGSTMIELLVSMGIFAMAVALAFGAVVQVMQMSREAQQSSDAQSELRIALAQIDRQVRSGNVLFSPAEEPTIPGVTGCEAIGLFSGTCMRIYTQSNGDQKCVQWQIREDPDALGTYELRTRSWDPDWATGIGVVGSWGVVARNLHYEAGVTEAPFTLSRALETGSDVTAYGDRMLVVHLEATDERRDHPIATESSITGRNTSYGYSAGQCTPVPTG